MQFLLVLVLLGPAQTIAGKYPRHSEEYLRKHPPAPPPSGPLPGDVAGLCRRIEGGDARAEVFAALGEALLRAGEPRLAYRAFHRAHRLEPKDTAWGRRMVERKLAAEQVPDEVIRREERDAELWVGALQDYERQRIAAGKDPADLTGFHARYGRAEDDLRAHVRARRLSGAGGFVGLLVGAAFALGARRFRRRTAALPFLVAALCAIGPAVVGQTGLFWWGAAFALAGAVAVSVLGRPAS